jgi:hypothetical protein
MPRGYRQKRRKAGPGKGVILITFVMLTLSLLWVWKADKVKEYYSRMKALEESKKALVAENAKLRTDLMDLKSLSAVDKAVSGKFGLTQKVMGRIFLNDPVERGDWVKAVDFVDLDNVTEWLEEAVVKSGKVTAKERDGDTE